jgi:hypothetical protein
MTPNVLENDARPDEINRSVAELVRALDVFQSLPQRVRSLWQKTVDTAVAGDSIERLHSGRDECEQFVMTWIRSMAGFVEFASQLGRMGNSLSPKVAELDRGLADLLEFHRELFQRWNTLEDLEDIVAEHTALPAESLMRLARQHPPPSEWFQQSDKPF